MRDSVYLEVTTDSGGDGTAETTAAIFGLLYSVEWVDGDFADGVDAVLAVTGKASGVDRTLLTLTDANVDKDYHPRTLEHNNAGGDLATYTHPLINGKLKLTVSSGGDTKTGGALVNYFDEP
jgi:hypothetical protein